MNSFFSDRKNFWGCLLSYIIFFIFGVLLSIIYTYLIIPHDVTFTEGFTKGAELGQKFSVVYSAILTAYIVRRKKLAPAWYLMSLLAAILAILMAMVLGLIPAAYLMSKTHPDQKVAQKTRPTSNPKRSKENPGKLLIPALFIFAAVCLLSIGTLLVPSGISTQPEPYVKNISKFLSEYDLMFEKHNEEFNDMMSYLNSINDLEKEEFFTKLVEDVNKGNREAQFFLATTFMEMWEEDKKHIKTGHDLLVLSAKQGYDIAQYFLGFTYEYGIGTPQNYLDAMTWYKKSANSGFKEAQEKQLELLTKSEIEF